MVKIAKIMPTEIICITRKIKGYRPSSLGARSFPVDRLADRLISMHKLSIFASGQS